MRPVSRICSGVRVESSCLQRMRLSQTRGRPKPLKIRLDIGQLRGATDNWLIWASDIGRLQSSVWAVASGGVTQYMSRCNRNIALGAIMTATEYAGFVDELAAAIAAGRLKPG